MTLIQGLPGRLVRGRSVATFQAQHVRAEIGEEHAGVRSGTNAGEFNDLDTLEWPHGAKCRFARRWLVPPQIVTEHAATDEPQLHLTGALDDGELARVAVVLLGGVIFH